MPSIFRGRVKCSIAGGVLAGLLAVMCVSGRTEASAQPSDDPAQIIVVPTNPAAEKAGRDGIRAARAGDDAGAIKLFTKAIDQLGPTNTATAELLILRGGSYRRLGQYDKALRDVDRALRFSVTSPVMYYARAMVLMSMHRYKDALDDFNRYRTSGPRVAYVDLQRGLALQKLGRFAEAAGAFGDALALAPDNPSLLLHRAAANTQAGRIDAAIADYTRCINLDPKPTTYFRRGNLYMRRNDYKSAVLDFSSGLELDSRMIGAYGNRANSYIKLGKYDLALKDYTALLKLNPRDALAYRNRGTLYKRLGRLDLARADYERGLTLAPNDTWFRDVLKAIDANRGH